MQTNGVLAAGAPLPPHRLRKVSFSYKDFYGRTHDDGVLIVLDVVAPAVEAIVTQLYARGLPLEQAHPMESFDGDDTISMAANNSSAFNARPITGGSSWSKHAYGVAIDINPLQNPYVTTDSSGAAKVLPPDAVGYLKRTPVRPGMAESIVDIFAEQGFLIWGGDWRQPRDYQHFEIGSRAWIAELIAMKQDAAARAFAAYARSYRDCWQQSKLTAAEQRRTACVSRIKQ
ncbi:M15 family metallopeptidase [Herbaspirillum sp. RTI4]|uniref:M15 family metallopeptidase n=1 Tax=Herbaspirillum sp. RTI4 TaxID=3048640 RepID=UPI002AB34F4F|nr:M15 family metallopeptidase [Herbaspirillum sp. RTI4]MDY7578429.1 M15 family metallopeptidase [Herbaspirillum sp. RTI4]MEA9982557.1 M15 family metallopeptidase [Herbaspirillum sp. RTI4]